MALQHWFTSISGSATHRVTGQWKRLSLAVDGAHPRGRVESYRLPRPVPRTKPTLWRLFERACKGKYTVESSRWQDGEARRSGWKEPTELLHVAHAFLDG